MPSYIGRFAPSPTGPLHAGSLVAALASWLDARAHGGQWLVRIEDTDPPRCVHGAAETILRQLADCGLVSDGPVWWQSQRHAAYQQALDALAAARHAYPCACTRADIARAHEALGWTKARHGDLVYPGTCRPERGGLQGRTGRAWRLRVPDAGQPQGTAATATTPWVWHDRLAGPQQQDLSQAVGDVVLRRADGLWAYQLAVVVDDAAQGITDVVRGLDLLDNTPRQQWLQHCLGLPTPRYLHTPLVMAEDGQKLSKQNGATALDTHQPLEALGQAAKALGLDLGLSEDRTGAALGEAPTVAEWLARAVQAWRDSRFMRPADR